MGTTVGIHFNGQALSAVRVQWNKRGFMVRDVVKRDLGRGPTDGALADALSEIHAELKGPKRVFVCLGDETAMFRFLELPRMSPREVRQALELDFQRFIPLPRESVYYDFAPVGGPEKDPPQMRVALAAAQKGVVDSLQRACRKAGLRLREVEVEGICLSRALTILGLGYQNYAFLVEQGGRSHLTIFKDDLPLVSRRLGDGLDPAATASEVIRSIQYFLTQQRDSTLHAVYVMSPKAGALVEPLRESIGMRLDQAVVVEEYQVDLFQGPLTAEDIAAVGAARKGAGKWTRRPRRA